MRTEYRLMGPTRRAVVDSEHACIARDGSSRRHLGAADTEFGPIAAIDNIARGWGLAASDQNVLTMPRRLSRSRPEPRKQELRNACVAFGRWVEREH